MSQKPLGTYLAVPIFALLLASCASTPTPAPPTPAPTTATPTSPPTATSPEEPTTEAEFSITDVDFTALEWSLAHHGRMIPTEGHSFANCGRF